MTIRLPRFTRNSIVVSPRSGLRTDELISTARDLEARGWEGVWVGEVGDDPFTLLGLLAANTARLQLGTSIATWTRSVPTMATSATTIDALSGGRFRLGIGTGPKESNEDWHGVDTSRMVRRMQEYLEAIRLAWTAHSGRTVDYAGEIFRRVSPNTYSIQGRHLDNARC